MKRTHLLLALVLWLLLAAGAWYAMTYDAPPVERPVPPCVTRGYGC